MSALSLLPEPTPSEIRAAIIRHLAQKLRWCVPRTGAFVATLSTTDICRCLHIDPDDTFAALASRGAAEPHAQSLA